MSPLAMPPGAAEVAVAGERLALLPERLLWWPAAALLAAADLHWGKAATFRAAGVPLPEGDLAAGLERLDRALAGTGARRLLVLGDLVHAGAGLTPEVVETVAAWRRRTPVELALVPGNHDRGAAARLPTAWRVERLAGDHREGPFRFTHDPGRRGGEEPGEASVAPPGRGTATPSRRRRRSAAGSVASEPAPSYTWAGHLHPTVRLRAGGDALRLPCFHLSPTVGLLPAFAPFTAGPAVRPRPRDRVFAVADDRVVEV